MDIYINKKRAYIKKDSSFDYIVENRLFTGSDGFSLNITLPLRGCNDNLKIFGNINRKDIVAENLILDCEIRSKKISISGALTITEITQSDVKAQFLQGRSVQNFDKSLDDIYINELELGSGEDSDDSNPYNAWHPRSQNYKCVALPWVNNNSGNIQNLAVLNESDEYVWHEDCRGRSWQPYLNYIIKAIADAVGYSVDIESLEKNFKLNNILICNCLPWAWELPDFSRALPHWTVAEFFEKLELFLGGYFDINHKSKEISFKLYNEISNIIDPVIIDEVIDEHSSDVSYEIFDSKYIPETNFRYKECDHEMWKFYSCNWFIKEFAQHANTYKDLLTLLKNNSSLKTSDGSFGRQGAKYNNVFYAEDVDSYFILRSLNKKLIEKRPAPLSDIFEYKMEMLPINNFGDLIINDKEKDDYTDIEFVPAWIDESDDKYKKCLFLPISSYSESEGGNYEFTVGGTIEETKAEKDAYLFQPSSYGKIESHSESEKPEYYDRIYLAWWDGSVLINDGRLPYPLVHNFIIGDNWDSVNIFDFSFKLKDIITGAVEGFDKINLKQKFKFKFITDKILDPLAPFFIKGKKFVCERLTYSINDKGVSQLVSGEFWPVID